MRTDAWYAALTRTAREFADDNCLGLAAQLAFYFLLALFPALLFLVALLGYVPIDDAFGELLAALGAVAPTELVQLLRAQLDDIREGSHASLLTIGIVGAIWSSSAAMVAIIDALNRAYDVTEWRPWWKRRLLAVLLTIALAVFIIIALSFVLVSPAAASWVTAWLGLPPAIAGLWSLARWPAIVLSAVVGIDLIYHYAPNRKRRFAWATPGALVATALWIACSFGFKWYVVHFGNYAAAYGAIGAVIITMLWFYLSSVAILIGAELNGVIEDAAPT